MKHTPMIAILSILLSASQLAQANLVTNGSFESGAFVPNADNTMSLPNGSTAMTGWTVIADSLSWINTPNPWSVLPSDGNFFLDFTDYQQTPAFGGVSQTITTVAGQLYDLSFDLGSSNLYGRPNSISASAGSTVQVFTGSSTGGISDWQHFVLPFTAPSTSTTISLTGVAGFAYIGLDNVSVSAVPLPASVWLFLSGIGALFARFRRQAR